MNDVSRRVAVLAKEKGFNGKSRNFFKDENSARTKESFNSMVSYKPYVFRDWNNSKEFINHITAPTQSQLQKWLRDKKIIVLVCHIGFDNEPFYYTIINHPRELDENDYFSTYEDAIDVGLFNALTLL